MYWRRTHRILRCYSQADLATPEGAAGLVDHMSYALNVPITPAERDGAVQWLVAQRINPHSPAHQMRMWQYVYGG